MRKLLLIITLAVCQLVLAGSVTPDAALEKAQAFLSQKSPAKARRAMKRAPITLTTTQQEQAPLYIFNVGDHAGYVIVSGDDRTEEILGYSDTGYLDEQNMPENMRGLLQEYADVIQKISKLDIQATSPNKVRKISGKASIAPLLTCTWNQSLPYNTQCPTYTRGNYTYGTVTGCVATAMAQVMFYHQWPNYTIAEIPAYTSYGNVGEIQLDAIPSGTAIDWSAIQPSYDYEYNGTTAEKAVATLMMLCGHSVEMSYGTSSGAVTSDVISALVKYFDYEEETAQFLYRQAYSYDQWQEIIYKELSEQRPVLFSGRGAGGGHAFVCDGYDEDDFFHINWGWGGTSNDYFRLNLLNPYEQGIGGSGTDDGFAIGNGIGIGIKKNDGVVTPQPIRMTSNYIYERDGLKQFTRSAAGQPFTGMHVMYGNRNNTGSPQTVDLGLRILDSNGNTVQDIMDSNAQGITTEYGWYTYYAAGELDESVPVEVNGSLPDGEYRLIQTSRQTGTTEMLPNTYWESVYLPLVISGNTLTVSSPDLQLVGEAQITGTPQVGSAVTVALNIINNGYTCRGDIYYYVNRTWDEENQRWNYDDYRPAAYLDLENGKSTTIQFTFTPSKSGRNTLTVMSPTGEVLTEVSFDVEDTGKPEFSTVGAENYNADREAVIGTTMSISLKVENTGGGTLNENATVYLLIYDNGWAYYNSSTYKESWDINLAAGTSETKMFTFENLPTGYEYCLFVRYQNDEKTYWSDSYMLRSEELQPNLSFATTGIANFIYDENNSEYTVPGTTLTYRVQATNTGEANYSDATITGRLIYLNESTNTWAYVSTTTAPAQSWYIADLAPGSSELKILSWSNLTIGTLYSWYLIYPLNGQTRYYWGDYDVRMVEPTGIEDTTVEKPQLKGNVYNMQGKKVGTADNLPSLQPGIYIVNGRKLVVK